MTGNRGKQYGKTMNNQTKIGVLLLNLGGPEGPDDVYPFLLNLFSDRQIIRLGPFFMQKFIARRIARKRAPASRANYRRIGGGSPIRARTEEQARALELALAEEGDFLVRPCMRYWHPFAAEVLGEMREAGVQRLIALSLYPHYSIATTGSSVTDLTAEMRRLHMDMPLGIIDSWPDQEDYIACLAARIREGIEHFKGAEVQLLYSAHSLPVQFVREGDPYVEHLERTIKALEERTGIQGQLCYQSRSGPVEWLGPSLPDTLRELAAKGCPNVLVLPISFVSDHVETLYEVDIQYRKLAQELGMGYAMTRALNADPLFIGGLRKLVHEHIA